MSSPRRVHGPNGPQTLFGFLGSDDYLIDITGNVAILGAPPDEVHLAWDPDEKHWVCGSLVLTLWEWENEEQETVKIWILFDASVPNEVDVGGWT